ncbi:SDR family oxidoreductase [Shinella pollutisoli]|uniref:SDR family oxidoreductase n=1 Tax=Shinella pollutisoli TaxID=2250594 RepID=A0ABV7DMM2_9HYPH
MIDLTGKTVVITGACGGIGSALVKAFARAGAAVVACDRSAEDLSRLAVAGTACFDVLDAPAARRAAAEIAERHGVPDILVSNAGYSRGEVFELVTDALWHDEVAINLNGTRDFADPVMRQMIEAGRGHLLFISSVNGLSHFGNPAYAAAKAGVISYMKAIAVEMGRHGLRANAICPGSVRTPAWDHRLEKDPQLIERTAAFYPLRRLVTPEEVANAALFLSSDMASGITGVALPVDAGLTAGNVSFIDEIVRPSTT